MGDIDRRSRAHSAIRHLAVELGLPTELAILSDRWNTVARLGDSGVIAKAATLADLARSNPAHWFQLEVDACTELLHRDVPVQDPYLADAVQVDGIPITLWHEIEGEMGECTEEQLVQSLVQVHEQGNDLLKDEPWFATITTHFDDVLPLLLDRKPIPVGSLDKLKLHYERLMDSIVATEHRNAFIHGDAQRKNAMRTEHGAVWIDFEEASYGPVAWDLACMTMHRRFDTDRVLDRYAELSGYARIDSNLIDKFKQLREHEGLTWMLAIQDEREPEFREETAHLLKHVLITASAD